MKYLIPCIFIFVFSACTSEEQESIENHSKNETTVALDSFDLVKENLDKNPGNRDVIFESAKFYIRHGKVEKAKTHLANILSVDSADLDVQKAYADIMMAELNIEAGKYHYEYILSKDSSYAGAYIGLGKLYAILNNPIKATLYLNEALKIDPHLPEPYFMKGMIYRADYYQTGLEESWKRALSSFQTAVEQDPNYYSAFVQMGVMYDEKGDDIALEYYNSAIDIYPHSLEAWYNKGMYYQNRSDIENAMECYREANRIDSTWADAYYNQGYIHLVITENLDSAIHFFDLATYWDPNYYQAFNNLGLSFEKKGNIEMAKQYYQKAIEINPDFQLAKDNLNALQ